jgi:hypothetical protein
MITYLIAGYGFSKSLDVSCHYFGVLLLVRETSDGVLCQKVLGFFFDLFQCSETTVGRRHN